LLAGLAVTCAVSPALADEHASTVFPPDAVIYGSTYSQWSAAWQQWSLAIPADQHPLIDEGGTVYRDCRTGQSGPVFFLGGTYGGTVSTIVRNCTVPKGKALYFPILNSECSSAEAKVGKCTPTIYQMRAEVAGFIDITDDYKVTLDGKPVAKNIKQDFRMQSPIFTVDLPANNILYPSYGEPPESGLFPAGQYFALDDGVYVMLKPLPPGDHVLKFQGTFNFVPTPWTLDVTYNLTQE